MATVITKLYIQKKENCGNHRAYLGYANSGIQKVNRMLPRKPPYLLRHTLASRYRLDYTTLPITQTAIRINIINKLDNLLSQFIYS